MMLKVLQGSVVAVFVLFMVIGLVILFAVPEKMGAYKELINILFPIFMAQVIPALIGNPLTEAVRNMTGGKKNVEKNSSVS